MDMNSGGGSKESYNNIYIQAPEEEAKLIFQNRFGHNPDRVSCTCCGSDYSISEYKTLRQATGYERNCKYDRKTETYLEEPDGRSSYRKYLSLSTYAKLKFVLIIKSKNIKPEERLGELHEQGYIWRD